MIADHYAAAVRVEIWMRGRRVESRLSYGEARREDVVAISALSGEGLEALRERMAVTLRSGELVHQISLPAGAGGRIAWLHARGEVLEQRVDGDQMQLSVRLSPDNWARFQAAEPA